MERGPHIVWLLWQRILWRHWCRSWKSTLALLLILALGVGVFFAIRLANRAAVAGFSLFSEVATGESELVITTPSGRISEDLLPELRRIAGDIPVQFFPVLEATSTEPSSDEDEGFFAKQLQVVGLDVPSLANLIYLANENYEVPSFADLEQTRSRGAAGREPGDDSVPRVFVAKSLLEERSWTVGETVRLLWNTTEQAVRIGGIIPESNFNVRPPDNLMLIDLPDLQRLTEQEGIVHRVEARVPPGGFQEPWQDELRAQLTAASNGRWILTSTDALRMQGDQMTRAFRLNLTILSGLALLVGTYLILQALEAAVVRRRQEIGILRSLGVEPGDIRSAWLFESVLLGLMGTGLGLLLGFAGAQVAVGAIAQTVNSLYFNNTVSAAGWNWVEAGWAGLLGLTASVISGWLPARDAAETPPAQVLQRGFRGGGIGFLKRPMLGVALLITGCLTYQLPAIELSGKAFFPLAGYLTALLWVVGGSICVGALFPVCVSAGRRWSNRFASVRFALSQLRRPTGRHRLAVAGLLIAFGMAAGMGILISSFEATMTYWINNALRADLYIAPQGVGNVSNQNRIERETWQSIVNDPAVAFAEIGQMYPVQIDGGLTYLVGAGGGNDGAWNNLVWRTPPKILDLAAGLDEGGIPGWINESFMNRFEVGMEDSVRVPTPAGEQEVVIKGVFADYGNERGSLMVTRKKLVEWFDDDRALNIAAYLRNAADAGAFRDRILTEHPGLVARLNTQLRADVLKIFRQTFAVTHALKWIGIAVAIIGLGLTMAALTLERQREMATLRELGMSRRQIAGAMSFEGALLALIGVVGGALLSVALGRLLIYVINRQSFGWTLMFEIPWWEIALTALAVIGVGAVVAWQVGRWAAQLRVDREE